MIDGPRQIDNDQSPTRLSGEKEHMLGQDAEALVAQLASAVDMLAAVSDRSAPGVYIVLTGSGAAYLADIRDPDAPPCVTRYAGSATTALRDRQPLPGTHGFSFNVATGRGYVLWWKDPSEYTDPSRAYGGTMRSTSRVLLVARLTDVTRAGQDRAVTLLHTLIDALRDPDLDYVALVARLWHRRQVTVEPCRGRTNEHGRKNDS